MKLKLIFFFCIAALSVAAQPRFDGKAIKEKFPDEDLYYLTDHDHINISLKENKLEIIAEISSDVLFLNDKANLFSRRSIYYYDEMEQVSNVNAATYVPNESGKLKKVEVEKTYTHKPLKDGVFYDDFKEIYFDFPSLRPNAVASFSYQEKYLDPHFIPPYFFANSSPSGDMEYSVTFPKEVSIKYLVKGDTTGLVFTSKETKNEFTYTWKLNNQKPFDKIREEGNYRKYAPHVIVYIDSYTVNNKSVPVTGSVKQLYSWYYTHISELVSENHDEIKQLSDSLTTGKKTDEEKIKAIYYWVQDNIKYIAFEYGLGGFIPRKANLICSRRFGDCKDKSSLLYALLKSQNIPVHFTWIGTRDIPYKYEELPTPAVDNHMIVSYLNKGQWTFLDGTSMELPYGYPSSFIQEKEALISISKDSFIVAKVPIVEKEKNYRKDEIVVRVNGDELSGTAKSLYGGLWRNGLCNSLSDISGNKRDEEFAKLFKYGNNKCKADSIRYEGLEGFSDTLSFNFNFTIPNYIRKIDNKLFVNLNLTKILEDELIELDKRETELSTRFKYVAKESVTLEIPEGYSVSKIPTGNNFKGEFFGFDITYHISEGKIRIDRSIYLDEMERPKTQFKEWNSMIEKLSDTYSQVVVLAHN